MKSIPLLFFCFVITFKLSSQETIAPFKHLTILNGLPSNFSSKIFKDKTGFMWFGSEAGLCRYDGYIMKYYNYDSNDTNSLNSNSISSICQDIYGNLWIGTSKGLNKYDSSNDRFVRYFQNDTVFSKGVNKMCSDFVGNLWMGLGSDHIIKYNDSKKEYVQYVYDENKPKGKGKGGVMCFHMDSKGVLWLTTWNYGISRYNFSSNDFTHYLHDSNDSSSIFKEPVFSIVSDGEDFLWVAAGSEGIAKMDKKTGKFIHVNKLENSPLGSFNMDRDPDGNVWFATLGDGLAKYDLNTHRFSWLKHRYDDPESLSENLLAYIHIDYSNVLWLSTVNNGINKLDLNIKDVSLCSLSSADKTGNERIYNMMEDSDNNIWINTNLGLYKYFPKTGQIRNIPSKSGWKNTFLVTTYDDNVLIVNEGQLLNINKNTYKVSPSFKSFSGNFQRIFQKKNGSKYLIADNILFYYPSGNLKDKPLKLHTFSLENFKDQFCNFYFEDQDAIYISIFGEFIHINNKGIVVTNSLANRDDLSKLGGSTNIYKADDSIKIYFNNKYIIYNKATNVFSDVKKFQIPGKIEVIPSCFQYDRNHICFSTFFGIYIADIKNHTYSSPYICDPSKINPDFMFMASDGKFYLAANKGFLIFDPKKLISKKTVPKVVITDFYLFNRNVKIGAKDSPLKENITTAKVLELGHAHSVFSFELALLNFDDTDKNTYAYILEGFESKWNYIGTRKVATYTNLPAGNYVFKYKAIDKNGNVSNVENLSIMINPPFWQTWWFRILAIILIVGTLYVIFRYRLRNIRRQKEELEALVILRTKEIESQQEKIIELYNDVTDSIQTAKFIQESILPPDDVIKQYLPESFIYYAPKDIVSGDFYWLHTHENKIYIAAVDCTGHGVAGAFMSLIAYNLLNRIIIETPGITPKEILEKLNVHVIEALNQESEHSISKDGMDISLCMIDKDTNKLHFSGANNPLYVIRNGQLDTYKADNNSIGIQKFHKVSHFTDQIYDILPGDLFYIFSDGIAGQFGGTKGDEKFKYTRFREALRENHTDPLEIQNEKLKQKLEEWKGGTEQTDDMLVIGFSML